MMHNFAWQWDDNAIAIAYETFGEGTQVLLLPAFSTVSSREAEQGVKSCNNTFIAQLYLTGYVSTGIAEVVFQCKT